MNRSSRRARLLVGITVGLVVAAVTTPAAGAAGITVKPGSNLIVGKQSYAAVVSASKGTFPRVPDPTATPVAKTVTTKVGSALIVGVPGTFSAADLGAFVEDGAGGRLPDGVPVTAITPLAPVYPRQGLASIKAVNLTGSTATLSLKAVAAGSGPVDQIAPTVPIILVTQSSGSIPFIAPTPNGLCLLPAFADGVCPYDPGNLAYGATKAVLLGNADGSFSTPLTLTEGVADGGLGRTPGPIFVKMFDPDGDGTAAPFAPFAVPADTPGAAPIGCEPGLADRSIPNPAVGGVDYCLVTAITLNAGVQSTLVPFKIAQFPITWAAHASGFVGGGSLAVVGYDFANDDVITKIVLSNAKAVQTAAPTLKCAALNQTITGVKAGPTGNVLAVIPQYDEGCTVPPTSSTRVTIVGSKDVQRSQIPPNDVIGTSAPKQAVALIRMTPPS
jgi:hypothetical protein